MRRASLLMPAALLMASSAAAQVSLPAERDDTPSAKDTSLEQGLADFERLRIDARGNDRVSRHALQQWAGCIVRKNPGEAARVLAMDFKTTAYGRALLMLSREDRSCVGFRGSLKSAGLLFAGELAESLVESDPAPLVNRLAKAASAPAAAAFSFTDGIALCVVRSVPNDVAALLGTERDGPEEAASLNSLATPMALCARAARATKPVSVNPAGLRAMLATAAFRSLENTEDS